MWSVESLHALNQEFAEAAREERRAPYVPRTPAEVDNYPPFPFPSLVTYEPPGWIRTDDDAWFVDSTGLGEEGEPALTLCQFRKVLKTFVEAHPGYGFGLVNVGPFQVYVGAYRPLSVN